MNPALILGILTSALQLLPVSINTVVGIKSLLAADPSIPAELQAILKSTADDNSATLAQVNAWLAANPQ